LSRKLEAALRAKARARWGIRAATGAGGALAGGAAADDEITDVRNPGECVCEDEHRVPPPQAIGQQTK
jgi:hypothetical protein